MGLNVHCAQNYHIVFNEIAYKSPLTPEASFIEQFNRSTNSTFDLSGWRINGADYVVPPGALIAPRTYLVIAKNRQAFAQAYGTGVPVLGEFAGQLDDGGEILTLLKPGAMPGQEMVVDRVLYDDDAPWSALADGKGPSLQLVDSSQDNSRVSNWSDGSGWRYVHLYGGIPGLPFRSRHELHQTKPFCPHLQLKRQNRQCVSAQSGKALGTALPWNARLPRKDLQP